MVKYYDFNDMWRGNQIWQCDLFLRPTHLLLLFLGLVDVPVLESLKMGMHQLNNDDSEFHSLNPDGPPNR